MTARFRRLFSLGVGAVLLTAGGALGGCGQTGPLYLPPPKPKPVKRAPAKARPEQTAPAPATAGR